MTISITRSFPLPNIIALGGVATGNMKAQEADNAAGAINNTGETSITPDADCRMGITNCVVAVLDVNSVNSVIPAVMDAMIIGRPAAFKACN